MAGLATRRIVVLRGYARATKILPGVRDANRRRFDAHDSARCCWGRQQENQQESATLVDRLRRYFVGFAMVATVCFLWGAGQVAHPVQALACYGATCEDQGPVGTGCYRDQVIVAEDVVRSGRKRNVVQRTLPRQLVRPRCSGRSSRWFVLQLHQELLRRQLRSRHGGLQRQRHRMQAPARAAGARWSMVISRPRSVGATAFIPKTTAPVGSRTFTTRESRPSGRLSSQMPENLVLQRQHDV